MERDMSDHFEGAICGVDGCTPAALDHFEPASGAKATLAIEVISDAICPWCWVAKRRLDRAIAAISPNVTASVTWRPFELNPEMPKAGVDRRAYRSAKFGSWQHSQALDAQVAALNAQANANQAAANLSQRQLSNMSQPIPVATRTAAPPPPQGLINRLPPPNTVIGAPT
jgi:hypothetical protein